MKEPSTLPAAAEPPVDTVEMTAETMTGVLVTAVIDELKAAPDVWQKLPQARQDEVIDRVVRRCKALVGTAVRLIAADGRDVIRADLEQITAKDEIKAVCKLAKHDEKRHALLDAVGKPVLIVVASAEPFMGGDVPTSEPDQRDLPVADQGAGPGANSDTFEPVDAADTTAA